MALVPVIFLSALSSEEDRILGFRLGADDYLPKPFRFEELDLRVDRALRTSRLLRHHLEEQKKSSPREQPAGDKVPSLKGSLEQLGVHAVLTVLEMEGKSGVLVMTGEGAETGRLFLRMGMPVGALLEGAEEVRGAAAIYGMLYWTAGSFEFTSSEVEMEDQIQKSVTYLLMEGARRMDEGL